MDINLKDYLKNDIDTEISTEYIPYKKKKKKKDIRSKHKHTYADCFFIDNARSDFIKYDYYQKGVCCTVCGRIKENHIFETEKIIGGFRVVNKTKDEMIEEYGDLPVFRITGMQKFVDVGEE